jgi:hypothetical protein
VRLSGSDDTDYSIPSLAAVAGGCRGAITANTRIKALALEWVEDNEDSECQYLVVGGTKLEHYVRLNDRETTDLHGFIQIWKLNGDSADLYQTIIHDFGSCLDLKLMPGTFNRDKKSLGTLAVAFGDGTVRILSVPICENENGPMHCIYCLI